MITTKCHIDATGSKGYHSDRTFSSERLSLQSSALVVSNPSDTSSSKAPPDYLIKTHGSLMVITWVGLVSVAIMIARHFKEYLGEGNVCGTKLWFLVSFSYKSIILLPDFMHE